MGRQSQCDKFSNNSHTYICISLFLTLNVSKNYTRHNWYVTLKQLKPFVANQV